jgi:hypothetical protein
MKAMFRAGVVSVCIGLGTLAYAQDPGGRPPAQREQREPQEVSYTGCLTKGTAAGQYMIVDQKTGERVVFGASEKIEKYLNQTVTLTGRISDRSGERMFQPESVKVVAPSCEAPPK